MVERAASPRDLTFVEMDPEDVNADPEMLISREVLSGGGRARLKQVRSVHLPLVQVRC